MILLFNQYFRNKNILTTLPINLLSLASYLRSKNMPCKIYDLGGLSDYDIKAIIKIENPLIIGIGCQFTPHYDDVLSIAKTIKEVNPKIHVVIGGNHASSLDHLDENIDYIVQGEGEENFYDLCLDLLTDGKSEPIRKPYPLIKDLDDLPILDYSLVDLKKYLSYHSPFFMREPCIGIITSRGCPNNCIFCTVKGVWGRTWRGKSPKRVADEIELLKTQGIREFQIMDDSASIDEKRWLGICDEIINRKLDIKWSTPNGIAHWSLTKQTLKKMKEAGCYRITFGIESGNPEIRKFIRKPYPLNQAEELIKYANHIGMWTISTNILGFPNETKEMMYDTYRFQVKSGVDFSTFFILDIYPTCDINNFPTDKRLAREMQRKFYKDFIIRRTIKAWNVIYKIKSFEDLRYVFRLFRAGVGIFLKSFYKKNTKELLYG